MTARSEVLRGAGVFSAGGPPRRAGAFGSGVFQVVSGVGWSRLDVAGPGPAGDAGQEAAMPSMPMPLAKTGSPSVAVWSSVSEPLLLTA